MKPSRKKPRQQRACATWDAILDAATHLFGELGYAATTTNKVAERAGVSIGSLYQYFPNKDALLFALAERHVAEVGEVLASTFAALEQEQPSLEDTIGRLIDVTVDLHQRDPALHRLLFDLTPRTPELMVRFRQMEQLLAAAVARQLIRLGAGGSHPYMRSLLLVQGVEAQVHGAVIEPLPGSDLVQVVNELKGLWLAALRS